MGRPNNQKNTNSVFEHYGSWKNNFLKPGKALVKSWKFVAKKEYGRWANSSRPVILTVYSYFFAFSISRAAFVEGCAIWHIAEDQTIIELAQAAKWP